MADLFGYIRISKSEAEKEKKNGTPGYSLMVQNTAIEKYCDLYDHNLVGVFVDDGISGAREIEKRGDGGRMMEALRDQDATGFVVHRLDRAFRDTINGLQLGKELTKRGQSIHSVTEHIDTSSAFGKLMYTQLLAQAEFERNRTCERNKDTYKELLAKCIAFGPIPYGLLAIEEGKIKRLYKHPEQWAQREYIVGLRARGLSFGAIVEQLRADGIRTSTGAQRWQESSIKILCDSHHNYDHIPFLEVDNEAQDSVALTIVKQGGTA